MEKVKVTKKVAEAIEAIRNEEGFEFKNFMAVLSTDKFSRRLRKGIPLNTVPIEVVASALLIGYEIEKSPEEKVREYYVALKEQADKYAEPYDVGEVVGIEFTLNTLGIKIDGVNA